MNKNQNQGSDSKISVCSLLESRVLRLIYNFVSNIQYSISISDFIFPSKERTHSLDFLPMFAFRLPAAKHRVPISQSHLNLLKSNYRKMLCLLFKRERKENHDKIFCTPVLQLCDTLCRNFVVHVHKLF